MGRQGDGGTWRGGDLVMGEGETGRRRDQSSQFSGLVIIFTRLPKIWLYIA